jgi:uncharacterized protein YqiB (DUF1249 family)
MEDEFKYRSPVRSHHFAVVLFLIFSFLNFFWYRFMDVNQDRIDQKREKERLNAFFGKSQGYWNWRHK